MKKPIKKKEVPNVSKAISVMGQKKFNSEVQKQAQSGVDINEAPDLVARMKLKGMI